MKQLKFIGLPLIVVLLWQLLSMWGYLPYYVLPSPVEIVMGLKSMIAEGLPPGYVLFRHSLESLFRVFCGFFIAACLGIPLGILMGWSQKLTELLGPFLEIFRPIPPLAWIPLAIIWFGIGITSAAFIIFLGAFFPILLNTISGVRMVDRHIVEATKVLGAKQRHILLKVIAPGALPSIWTGLRIGLGIAWMTLVAAEFTGVKSGYGLGYLIMVARDIQRPDLVIAGMITIGLIGYGLDGLFQVGQKKLLKWM
jgi:ABC-type nitrate/sulfonate/bicarbonate transport system permease component